MANKRIKELKALSKDELAKRIRDTESELFKGRIKLKTAQLENTAMLWKLRKDLARMKMLVSAAQKKA